MPDTTARTTPPDNYCPENGLRSADAHSRIDVADIAVRLFATGGYDTTSTTDIAAAAGVSRSTFFRQFRSKDDVIFADHEELLEQIDDYFAVGHDDPWLAVCEAAMLVYERFRERLDIVRVRDLVVRQASVLRDRETVMISRYEKTFSAYLRRQLPGVDPVVAIQFAAAVTATHNFELRRLIRSSDSQQQANSAALATELTAVRHRFAPVDGPRAVTPTRDLLVAVFPASVLPEEVARVIQNQFHSSEP